MEQKQFEAMLSDAETRLRRLKTLYDQWLVGIERLEPNIPRKELEELLGRLKREQIRNTALRFRLQQFSQRHMTLTTYWKRLARQIEEGTYQRDVIRARKVRAQHDREVSGASGDGNYEVDVDVDVDTALAAAEALSGSPEPDQLVIPSSLGASPPTNLAPQLPPTPNLTTPSLRPDAKRPPPVPGRSSVGPRSISPFALPLPASAASMPPIPGAAAKGLPPPPPSAAAAAAAAQARAAQTPQVKPAPASLSTDDVQRIYARYVAARKDNAERVDNVRIETIEKSLRSMLPQLEKKHAGKKIDFEVVVKDGKVALKPVPK